MAKAVYVIAHHPDRTTSYAEGDPPTQHSAYYFEADKDSTLTAILEANATRFPIGTELVVVDESKTTTFTVSPEVKRGKAE